MSTRRSGFTLDAGASLAVGHTGEVDKDRDRWDARYADRPLATAVAPEALSLLTGDNDVLPHAGRAVDVACGLGPQALWLAARGLNVVALDVSPVAVAAVRDAAARDGVFVDARVHDLDVGFPDDVPADSFDVVVCQRFRNQQRYGDLAALLRHGGIGIVTVLSSVGLAGEPGEFHATPGELLAAFGEHEVLTSDERDGVASIVFRRR